VIIAKYCYSGSAQLRKIDIINISLSAVIYNYTAYKATAHLAAKESKVMYS